MRQLDGRWLLAIALVTCCLISLRAVKRPAGTAKATLPADDWDIPRLVAHLIRLVVPDTGKEIARLTAPEQARLKPFRFTPDGPQLIAVGEETRTLYIFDLRAIREGLAELDLDWDAPPYPPAAALSNAPPPLQITVDLGLLVPEEEPRQAVAKYSLALAVMPNNPVAYLRRGHAYFQLNQWNQAIDDLSLALRRVEETWLV
jgi:hypothetical protein